MGSTVLTFDDFDCTISDDVDLSGLIRMTSHVLPLRCHPSPNPHEIQNTQAIVHIYQLECNLKGEPELDLLVERLSHALIDYAIPRWKMAQAREEMLQLGASDSVLYLRDEAKKLFKNITDSGEGGEILLYWLAERELKLPQVIAKMSLKTNSEVYIHGSDGVHLGINQETKQLQVYWGESKIYSDPNDAIRECLKDISPYILQGSCIGRRQNNEIRLILNELNFENKDLENSIREYLNPNGKYFRNVEMCAVCLIGSSSNGYNNIVGKNSKDIAQCVYEEICKEIPNISNSISRRIIAENISSYKIHLFYVPFSNAEDFRTRISSKIAGE